MDHRLRARLTKCGTCARMCASVCVFWWVRALPLLQGEVDYSYLEEEDGEEKGGTLKGGGQRRRGNGSAEGRPQLYMGSEKTPGAGNRGYPVLGRG